MRGLIRVASLCAVVLLAGAAHGATSLPVTGWLTFAGGVERLGSTSDGIGSSRHAWFYPLASTVTTAPLVARNVPRAGDRTVYVADADGFVYAFAPDGYVRWRTDLGHMNHPCPQIPDGYGVTGAPVIDPASRSLMVVDAFGRMHALDLATGKERQGWPVVLYKDDRQELDWGASTIVDGSVYVGTGSYCDQPPMEGKLIRVRLDTREVTSWTSVPLAMGGGGSVWEWGGASYSPARQSLFVGTGNTFRWGANVGKNFNEQAGYGEHVVELSLDLAVKGSSAPPELRSFPDNAFVGAPVIVDRAGCAEQVAAQTKSGLLYGWAAGALSAGPAWTMKLQTADPDTPLITEPSYSPQLQSLFIVTASQLDRIAIDASCKPHLLWSLKLGDETLYGSPIVAGKLVWVAYPTRNITGRAEVLLGIDARTGRVTDRRAIGGISFAQPAVLDGMLFLGVMHGFSGKAFPVAAGRPASALPEYTSFADAKHGWQSREDGVYATSNGGRAWRRLLGTQAVRVVRTSATAGVVALGVSSLSCDCATRRLVTVDGGKTWAETQRISGDFQGRGGSLYWWSGGSLFRLRRWPVRAAKIASTPVAKTDGAVVDAVNVPGGLAALVDRGLKPPQVIVAHGAAGAVVTLPGAGTQAVPRTIAAAWPNLTVTGTDYSHPDADADPVLVWRSSDGGKTWALATS